MDPNDLNLSQASLQMLVSSLTDNGKARISEIEAERFLNALARLQQGVPTGTNGLSKGMNSQNTESHE